MLHLADASPLLRRNLAVGRLSERITGRGLPALSATLSLQAGSGPILLLPADFVIRTEGYFAFNILPERDLPDVAGAAAVRLRAEFRLAARDPIISERTVAGSALALIDSPRIIAGRSVTVRTLAGPPIDLSAAADPAPVALQGIVLRAHDPARPIGGIGVAVGPLSTTTDAQGRFLLPALPLAAEITVRLTEDGTATDHALHLDYERPVNHAVLSLPS